MKSGGEFSHLKAIQQSLRETLRNIGEKGFVREWQDAGIIDEKSKLAFHASAVEQSFIKEPVQGLVGGMVHFFGNAAEQAGRITKDNPNPLSKAGAFIYYVVRDTIKGTGEGLGEGVAQMYTARTSDQLVEGVTRFYGGVGGAAGMVAGGVAGAATKLTVPTITATGGAGISGLAIESTAIGAPAVTAMAGAVAGGAVAHAMVIGEQTSGVQGGGRSSQSGAVPRQLSGSWKEKGRVIRSLSDEELVLNAEKYTQGLKQPNGGYSHSRPVADLIAQELKRRGKEGMSEAAQKLELAIEKSAYDHMCVTHCTGVSKPLMEDYTVGELTGRARTSIERIRSGVDKEVLPFHRELVDELRGRASAIEGQDASGMMKSLADQLEGTLQRVRPKPDTKGMAQDLLTRDIIKEAKNILKKNDVGVDRMHAYANELRVRASSKGWLGKKRMNRLADQIERKIPEAEARARAEAAKRGTPVPPLELPPSIKPRPITEWTEAELSGVLRDLGRPHAPGRAEVIFLPYEIDVIKGELAKRRPKP